MCETQLLIDGTPNVAVVVAKRAPGGEVVRSSELEMTTRLDRVFRPRRDTVAVWISAHSFTRSAAHGTATITLNQQKQHSVLWPVFQDNLSEPVRECQTVLGLL